MLNQYEDNLQNERTEKARLSEDYENRVHMLTSVRELIKVTYLCVTCVGILLSIFDISYHFVVVFLQQVQDLSKALESQKVQQAQDLNKLLESQKVRISFFV